MDLPVDPYTGAPVVIAAGRQGRPNLPSAGCPFCPGGIEAPEPYRTRAFVNRWPSISDGRSEVVLFSPDHDSSLGALGVDDVVAVVDLWAERTAALGDRDDVSYVHVFENRGAEVGATIPHPHGQVFAFPFVPPAPAGLLARAETGCPSCAGPTPGHEVEASGSGDHAWRSWVPATSPHPYGMVVAPVAHVADLPTLDPAGRRALAEVLGGSLARLDRHFGAAAPYMLWFHQRPCDGGAWPSAHVHAEIVPLWRATGVPRYVAAGEVGSGVFINPVEPAAAAAALREA